jgi:hypothetical protein
MVSSSGAKDQSLFIVVSKRQETASCVNFPNSQSGGHGSRTQSNTSLKNKDLVTSSKSGVIKSVIIPDNPGDEQLSDVISAWSALPPNIRIAIILLVQQHVQ